MSPLLLGVCVLIGVAVMAVVYFVSQNGAATNAAGTSPASEIPLSAINEEADPRLRANVTAGVDEQSLTSQTSNLHEVLLQRSRSERVVKPWLDKLNSILTGATPQRRLGVLHDLAITAGIGQQWTKGKIATARTISLGIGLVIGVAAWIQLRGVIGIIFAAIVIALGWRAFDVYLTNRARSRQEAIAMQLPDIADQIAISVQAGLGFEQAIRRTVDSTEGSLSEELGRFLQDTRVGISRPVAFRHLQERVNVPDVTSFVRAIAQAEKTGVSIAEILQIQSDELREKRKQRAEERAMKLPVLMLVPLVTCILPPLLIVLLGPAIIQVVSTGFG